MKRFTIVLFILLITCINVYASNWYRLEDYSLIDLDSIRPYKNYFGQYQKNTYEFWIKDFEINNEIITIHTIKYAIDCDNRKFEALSYVGENLKGEVINSGELSNYYPSNSIPPDSRGEIWYNFVCLPKRMN